MIHLSTFKSLFIAAALSCATLATPALSQNARDIMNRMDAAARAQNDNSFTVMQLSTCKFGISGGKVKCSQRPTVKRLESAARTVGNNGRDTQSLAVVLEPASERGIGMLSYNYDSGARDNETWLYLSSLGKVKRIVASSNASNSEPVSLFGSEFTTEDQETGKLDDYTYTLLDTVTFAGRKAYVIEQIPTPARARKTRYAKTIVWVDAERFVTLKAEMYDRRGTEIRRLIASKFQRINGIWLARSITILNLVSNRLSNMAMQEIHFGVNIDAELLTQRALTDKAFRERGLNALRAQAN